MRIRPVYTVLVILAFVLGACSNSTNSMPIVPSMVVNTVVPLATATATSVVPTTTAIPSTATSVPTATATALPSSTPTSIATATPEIGVKVSTEFKTVDFKSLPIVSYDDILSGKLATSEHLMLKRSLVEAPGIDAVSLVKPLISNDYAGKDLRVVRFDESGDREGYKSMASGKKLPYRTVSVFLTEVEGKKLLVFGIVYANRDGSNTILHYGFENFLNKNIQKIVLKTISGEYYILPVTNLFCGPAQCDPFGWIDYSKETILYKMYHGGKLSADTTDLVDKWVETGNLPAELEDQIFLGLPFYYSVH